MLSSRDVKGFGLLFVCTTTVVTGPFYRRHRGLLLWSGRWEQSYRGYSFIPCVSRAQRTRMGRTVILKPRRVECI